MAKKKNSTSSKPIKEIEEKQAEVVLEPAEAPEEEKPVVKKTKVNTLPKKNKGTIVGIINGLTIVKLEDGRKITTGKKLGKPGDSVEF